MITINKPYIYSKDNKTRLEAIIVDGKQNKELNIWYEVSENWGGYLCAELADAFLLAVLPVAADSEQDIVIHANVSPKLLYAVKKVHIPFYSKFLKKKVIHVTADSANAVYFSGKAVATGCSLGVDSLSTIYQHIDEECIPEYRLTHLTLFNSCQLGNVNQEKLNSVFEEACRSPQQFADEIGLGFVPINTNITELTSLIELDVLQYFHYFTISCVMALQKLFGKYLLSSGYNSENVCFDVEDLTHTESMFVPMMSNENVEVILSDTFTKRTEKTDYINKKALTHKYLDVCWSTQSANLNNGSDIYLKDRVNRNCGWCDKCLRTFYTLDILGSLSDYENAFDLDNYNKHKKDFASKVVAKSSHNIYYQEIYELMLEKGVQIPIVGKVAKTFDVSESKLLRKIWGIYLSSKIK